MNVEFPTTVTEAIGRRGAYRAGGIDQQDLLEIRPWPSLVVDVTRIAALRGVVVDADGTTRIGATTPIREVIEALGGRLPAIALTGAQVATPQVRNVATIAGNLTQSTRCWYFRNPLMSCWKTGGQGCPAREGDDLYGVVFDQGPCVFPSPTSMGMALLAHDAAVEIDGDRRMPIAELWGDGSDPTRDHVLGEGELITSILVPPPWPGERGGYRRAISRSHAEWPLVEAVCRVVVDDGVVTKAAVGVGGVANTPLRLREVEDALIGGPADRTAVEAAATLADRGARPLPQTGYKVPLMITVIADTVIAALESD